MLASGISFAGSDVAGTDFLANNLKISTTAATGSDASFSLDGVALTKSTNDFTISGVNYSLKSVGGSAATPVKVAVSSDIDTTVANVKAYVESYNALLEKVNTAIGETKYKDYTPLTDTQKTDMKEADITAWEAKAKSGLLRNDPILRQMVDKVRGNLSTPVSGVSGQYNSASAIGITTGTYTEGGKLYLDESKLRTALAADSDAVKNVFGKTGESSSEQGISVRMYDSLKVAMDSIVSEAGISASASDDSKSSLAKKINTYTKDMYNLNTRLTAIEDRYYKQFDAMEVALTKLTNQSSWLQQQLGTNSSSS